MRYSIRTLGFFVTACALFCVWPLSNVLQRSRVLGELRQSRVSIKSSIASHQQRLRDLINTASNAEHLDYFPDDHSALTKVDEIVAMVIADKLPAMPNLSDARLAAAIRACERTKGESLVSQGTAVMYRVSQLQRRLNKIDELRARVERTAIWSSCHWIKEQSDAPEATRPVTAKMEDRPHGPRDR